MKTCIPYCSKNSRKKDWKSFEPSSAHDVALIRDRCHEITCVAVFLARSSWKTRNSQRRERWTFLPSNHVPESWGVQSNEAVRHHFVLLIRLTMLFPGLRRLYHRRVELLEVDKDDLLEAPVVDITKQPRAPQDDRPFLRRLLLPFFREVQQQGELVERQQ